MKKAIAVFSMVTLVVMMSSCATVFKGNHSKVKLRSEPQGARVFVNGIFHGETPLKLYLKSNKNYVIEFRKPGYKPVIRQIKPLLCHRVLAPIAPIVDE